MQTGKHCLMLRVSTFEINAVRAAELDGLPESLEECDAEEADVRGRAERMTIGDRGVLDRYRALCAEVDKNSAAKEAIDAEVADLQARPRRLRMLHAFGVYCASSVQARSSYPCRAAGAPLPPARLLPSH